MKRPLVFASMSLVVLAFAFGQTSPPAPKAPTKGFPAVQAIFKANCMPCHGAGPRQAGDYNASTYAGVMGAGEHGKEVVPGKPDKSPLMAYLKGTKKPPMPMRRAPLKPAELKTISDWIKAGAKNK